LKQKEFQKRLVKMHFTRFLLAALPALVMATEDEAPTTTCTSTTTLTKTLTLSQVHTVTASYGHNTTTSYMPTIGTTSYFTSPTPSTTGSSDDESEPTEAPEPGPDNAGAALDAGKMAWAGLAGIIVMMAM
jgi:hypothetical protein